MAFGTGTLALAVAILAAVPAAALPADPADAHILVFANAGVNDTSLGGEVSRTIAVLEDLGGTVTTFDGGDGSDVAWSAALAGIDVLSLPEPERAWLYVAGGTPFMSDSAAAVVKAWTTAGGQIVANASIGLWGYEPLVSFLTGLDYAAALVTGYDESVVWELQDDTILDAPTALTYVNGTYGMDRYGSWSPELKAILTPIYVTADQQNMAVGSFAVGSGAFVFLAYDWYSDPALSPVASSDWERVLQLATQAFPTEAPVVVVVPPAPELAAAGVDGAPLAVGGGLLVLLGLGLLAMRRRVPAA